MKNWPEPEDCRDGNELFARFVIASRWYVGARIKPDAFMPHNGELSVSSHDNRTESEIWQIGTLVAGMTPRPDGSVKTLYGRADISLGNVQKYKLKAIRSPTAIDGNHANITDWPNDKAAQKSIAQALAASSGFRPKP